MRHRDARRVVEVFLLNAQPVPPDTPDRERLFQAAPRRSPRSTARAAIFLGHNDPDLPELRRDTDDELRLLALQHREQRLVRHRPAVRGRRRRPRRARARAWRLRTTCFPAADVPMVVAGDPADMPGARAGHGPARQPRPAARRPRPRAAAAGRRLPPLARRAGRPHRRRRRRSPGSPTSPARRSSAPATVADRLDRAVELLATNPQAREAFRFANQAMARQRVRSELVRRRIAEPDAQTSSALLDELDVPTNRSWRPFQLAFVLLCLPGLTDPAPSRTRTAGRCWTAQVQLLFFPTGGGKTEAYLGLTAYTIAIRRLQGIVGDRRRGPGRHPTASRVLMRYTLRLLTAQQFQRATALICACELLRRERVDGGDLRWGSTPMRIGLWVGVGGHPEHLRGRAAPAGGRHRPLRRGPGRRPAAVRAPARGAAAAIDLGRDGYADRAAPPGAAVLRRPGRPLPVQPRPLRRGPPGAGRRRGDLPAHPGLLIGTVDKFAALPWRAVDRAPVRPRHHRVRPARLPQRRHRRVVQGRRPPARQAACPARTPARRSGCARRT